MFLRGPSKYFGFITSEASLPRSASSPLGLPYFSRLPERESSPLFRRITCRRFSIRWPIALSSWRAVLPDFIAEQLPVDVEELRQAVVAWLGLHAGELKQVGAEAGRTLAHIFLGLGIGVLASLHDVQPHEPLGPLARAMQERVVRVGEAFRRVVFAQTRISAINTLLTALVPVRRVAVGGRASAAG